MSVLSQAIREAAQEPPDDYAFGYEEEAPRVVARRKFPLLTIEDLSKLPEQEWLIDRLLPERATAMLYGVSNLGKSFLSLDFSLSIAAGVPWAGRAVKQGMVVYEIGEGHEGLAKRVEAWLARHPEASRQTVAENFLVLNHAVQLADHSEVQTLLGTVEDLPSLRLVVVDTLSRSIRGVDDNSARDMGLVVEALEKVKTLTGATTIVLHHTTKDGKVERGSAAFRNDSDIVMGLHPRDGHVVLSCDKQRNFREFDPVKMRLIEVGPSACFEVVGSGIALDKNYGTRDSSMPAGRGGGTPF